MTLMPRKKPKKLKKSAFSSSEALKLIYSAESLSRNPKCISTKNRCEFQEKTTITYYKLIKYAFASDV
jgi:hypothetical protein